MKYQMRDADALTVRLHPKTFSINNGGATVGTAKDKNISH